MMPHIPYFLVFEGRNLIIQKLKCLWKLWLFPQKMPYEVILKSNAFQNASIERSQFWIAQMVITDVREHSNVNQLHSRNIF